MAWSHGDTTAVIASTAGTVQGWTMTLNETQLREVLSKVLQTIDKQFMGAEPDTERLRQEHESAMVRSTSGDKFEAAVNAMLKGLGTSHVGFFHHSRPRAAGRIAIAATFMKVDTPDGQRWMFQDGHPGGAVARAGIRPGDVLLTIDGKDVVPPEGIPFQLGAAYTFTVRRPNGSTTEPTVEVPGSRERKRPFVVPDQVVTATKLDEWDGPDPGEHVPRRAGDGRGSRHEPSRR